MSSLGRFLEISIPAEDVEDSLSFYRRLGFFELPVGEIRAYNYAVVSDGSVCLGLHADGVDQLSLSFVKPNIARHSRTFRDLGLELEFERLADDEFNEAAVADPDGHQALLLEARTFSSSPLEKHHLPLVGPLYCISLSCAHLESSLEFWELLGFELADAGPGRRVCIEVSGLRMELREENRRRPPVLNFRPSDLQQCLTALKQQDIDAELSGNRCDLKAPEGTALVLEEPAP